MNGVFNLEATLEQVRHLLPAQAPIQEFVHHNTLHAFQAERFEVAVLHASEVYGSKAYMPLDFYRKKYAEGQISKARLQHAIAAKGLSTENLFPENLQEGDLISYALFNWVEVKDRVAFDRLSRSYAHPIEVSYFLEGLTQLDLKRHASLLKVRERLQEQLGIRLDPTIHPILFRWVSAYLDQGIGLVPFPKSQLPFFEAIGTLIEESIFPIASFVSKKTAKKWFKMPVREAVSELLLRIVGQPEFFAEYIQETLMAHPGWSGMVATIEGKPHSLLKRRAISLLDFLAVKLVLELEWIEKKGDKNFLAPETVSEIKAQVVGSKDPFHPSILSLAHLLMRFKVNAKTLLLEDAGKSRRERLLSQLNQATLGGIWHEAFESTYYHEVLSSVQLHNKRREPEQSARQLPTIQAFFCIDDREGSFRRYLEESNPQIQTYSVAGFFGLDMAFQSIHHAFPVQSCPIHLTPKYVVKEVPAPGHHEAFEKQRKIRFKGALSRLRWHESSMSVFLGWLTSSTVGHLSIFRLILSVLHPIRLARILTTKKLSIPTELELFRDSAPELSVEGEGKPGDGSLFYGFSHDEMAQRVYAVLRSSGLTENFAELLVFVGHGSSSVNNPHFSAYDCGACSGKPGAPNARSFAAMANMPEVRTRLADRGLQIPAKTRFVGGYHDTCNDTFVFFDTEHLTQEQSITFKKFILTVDQARALNAKERCRRFALVDLQIPPEAALQEVMKRSQALFEPRPELNHATNALCVIGRREVTQGLFLDRRAFLNSYDPLKDADGAILNQILNAAVPVCGGINLEYFFCRIDETVYGCGTKLSHNVCGLIGVMNGIDDDLRTGLPVQMTEVHDPVRMLFIIEQRPEIVKQVLLNNSAVNEWVSHSWIQLACLVPGEQTVFLYQDGEFREQLYPEASLPKVASSALIVETSRDNIRPHEILQGKK